MTNPDYVIRELTDCDLPIVARLMAEGFPRKSLAFWQAALAALQVRRAAPGTPAYGYGIEADGLQGAALALGSLHDGAADLQTIVNISSWTVRPPFRGPAAKDLYRYASSFDGPTYSNLSAAAHTLKTITAFGFREGTAGQIIGIGVGRDERSARRIVPFDQAVAAGLADTHCELLRYHAERGCIVGCIATADRLVPLILMPRRIKPGIPVAQLIYCERLEEFSANSLSIYLWLLAKGYAALLVDASGPVKGLRGKYYPGRAAKYYKGPLPRHAVDHSYSEMIYIGF